MNQIVPASLARRRLLQGGAALVFAFSVDPVEFAAAAGPGAARPPLTPDQLDSFIALQADGTVVAYYGKMDPGQGVDVAIGQIVAEELDLPAGAVRVIQGDTGETVNQGGASGSTGIEKAGVTLRYAAAEARRVLVARASARLGVPAERLGTADGAVFVVATPDTRIAYKDCWGMGISRRRCSGMGRWAMICSRAERRSPRRLRSTRSSASPCRGRIFATMSSADRIT